MAEKKVIELDVQSNLGSLKSQLKQAQQEVQTLADKFGATSEQAIKAAKRAAELKDKIGDAKSLTDAFNPDAKFKSLSGSLTGVAGGFSAVTGAMGAFGAENKDVEQALLKVQSAMALTSGLQAVGESIDSFKQLGGVIKDSWKGLMVAIGIKKSDVVVTQAQTIASAEQIVATEGQIAATEAATVAQEGLNVAVSMNPFVLIGIAIAAIVGVVYAFRNEITKAFAFFDKLGPKTKVAVGIIMVAFAPLVIVIYGVFKALEALGLKDDANTIQMKENAAKRSAAMAKEADKNIESLRKIQKMKTDSFDFEIRMAEASGKNTENLEKRKRMSIYMTGLAVFKEQKKKEKGFVDEYRYYKKIGQLDDERAINALKNIKKIRGAQYQQYLENKKVNEDMKVAQAEQAQAAADAYREKRKAQIDAVNGLKAELEAVRLENIAAAKTDLKRSIDAVDTKYDLLKQRAINNKLDYTEIEKARLRELDAINKADAASKLEAEKKLMADMKAIDDADWNDRKAQIEIKNKYIVDDDERARANVKLGLDEELVTLANQLDDKKITQAQYDEYTKIAAARSAEEIAAINKTAKDKELAAFKAVEETKKAIRDADIANAEAAINLISGLFEGNKKVQAAALIAENALAIAKTIIATKTSNQLARAAGTAVAIETFGASTVAAEALVLRNNIGAGLSIAGIVAATAKGLSALKAGGSPTGGDTGGGGGGGGGGSVMSAKFNVVGNSGINQLGQLQQRPTKAYVVSGDMSTAQSLERNRIENATVVH